MRRGGVLDVAVVLDRGVQVQFGAEHGVGDAAGQFPALRRPAGLDQQRMPLRGRALRQRAGDGEEFAAVIDAAAGRGVAPQRQHHVDELRGAPVPRRAVRQIGQAEVAARRLRIRGDDVPRQATTGELVEAEQPVRQLHRVVERRRERADQPEMLGFGGDGRQDHARLQGLRRAQRRMIAHRRPVGQKQRIQRSAFGDPGHPHVVAGIGERGRRLGRSPPRRGVDAQVQHVDVERQAALAAGSQPGPRVRRIVEGAGMVRQVGGGRDG
ncbi:hypothetical protein PICSAR10_01448 [Mycobacterium avium subsp. paratuberculosis]|nr:hypothetical protein PICSAR10_01448 [Mycobacterium avium subsp. paratuberculosis]